ncbi:sensor histidine kinase [Vibrio sp. T187]|uniref:sensor histidine kinase n=1 Tax=Vibrio TaxID=662 RepID=UPI0010C9B7A1|nr:MULTISPECIES: sensor histidine kinase [Vibrio]MBW3695218.1 sensor histidine kinase [Vibrio sp. T187]
MTGSTSHSKQSRCFPWVKSALLTTVFCTLIAITTQTIWGGELQVSLLISFGFGYSALLSSLAIVKLFPTAPKWVETLGSMLIAIALGTINAQYWLNGFLGESFSELKSVVLLGVIFCAICYYYFYTKEQKLIADNELEVAKRRQADQEKVVVLSQLKQLQSQIEPHFLFNTLANISVLIETDSDKAKLMLEKLTDLLRATLNNSRNEQSTIGQELDLIDAYLNIQKIRLGERLKFSIEIDGADRSMVLPPFLIQPLVENALTHGIEPAAAGGEVKVCITENKDGLEIQVSDNGAGLNNATSSSGNGMALANIRQRIDTLFDGKAKLTIKEQQGGGVISMITLPKSA